MKTVDRTKELGKRLTGCQGIVKEQQSEIEELKMRIAILQDGVDAVNGLMENSVGVEGLHMNGDFALWSELLEGGSNEAWLIDFSMALDVYKKEVK